MDTNNFAWRRWLPIFLITGLGLTACKSGPAEGCRPDAAADAATVPVKLQRLEPAFFRLKTPAEALQFMNAAPRFARYYLQRQPSKEQELAKTLVQLATNPALQQLGRETAAAFPDSAALRHDVSEVFRRVHHYFPDFRVPASYTYVSGFLAKDIYVNDSLLVMSLDWFVGPKASKRPDLPQYMLRRYTPRGLMPLLAQDVASKYNKHELTANTMLDAMVHAGKTLYFASQMLPCTPDSVLMGYTGREMIGLEGNEARVWGHFLEKNLLYSTTPFLLQKYVGERPNVPEIDKTCPGRVGQWVGLQIIRKYVAEHPNVPLARLMAETNAQRLLNDSHYRPKKP
ncbi:gliding motility lipoprotein GldB [Hymenobacter sp. DH14]|uniref:Gliding motility lipoprotein GldB n=1 Tax=Hymenobacter cyanobacteriorum TaxID=2926463 RepID=A0A9X1VKW7_9BACT|nr:gliding motility lipoprotein GldB [Hymenobacter cyanobacteriorum]MCI1190067.1 gliding motility lipoprotein GldB [Hymenobacter cyanobacteriorum]